MKCKFVCATVIFFCCSLPALACSTAPEWHIDLNFYDKKQISEIIKSDYPELKGWNNVRAVRSFGTLVEDTAKTAEIRFKTHVKADNGAPLFYQMESLYTTVFHKAS